jgi:hypothetical protein
MWFIYKAWKETLTAQSIGGDELRTGAHIDVLFLCGEGEVGNKLIGNDLDANEFTNTLQISSWNAKQECDWIANVSEDELEGEVGFTIFGDVDISNRDRQFCFQSKKY